MRLVIGNGVITMTTPKLKRYRVMIFERFVDVDASNEAGAEAIVLAKVKRGETELDMITWPVDMRNLKEGTHNG